MPIEALEKALLILISTPLKPGSIHRLLATREFEERLVEAFITTRFMEEAYKRGVEVRQGKLEATSSGVGELISAALLRIFEETGEEPIVGLVSSAIVASMIKGVASERLKNIKTSWISSLLYSSGAAQAVKIVEALEAVGASRLVEALDRSGITRRSIELESRSLGDVFEALSRVDSGFWINIRWYKKILEAARPLARSRSVTEAALKAYITVGRLMGLLDLDPDDLERIAVASKRINRKRELDSILGGAFLALSLIVDEKGLWRI